MCRLAAYIGPDITLRRFLLEPEHSLYRQSWEPRELKYAKLNADGYGFGWFGPDGQPSAYTSMLPVWSDHNLPALADTLSRPLWLAEVRSATEGSPVHAFNTAPFHDDRLLFLHNGFIRNFYQQLLPHITAWLAPDIAAGIRGNTDSEYLFACLRQIRRDDTGLDLASALTRLFEWLADPLADTAALLNIVVTDGTGLTASRHGYNHECASLYYSTADVLFPGGQLIASECFSANGDWQTVPEHHLLILADGTSPELRPL